MKSSGAISGLVAFALTVLTVPVIIALSARWHIFDADGPLKIHTRPTSRLGGIAIALSLGAAKLLVDPRSAVRDAPLFAAFGILFAIGVADDLWNLSPYLRLTAQVLAAGILPFAGWRLPIVSNNLLNLIATVLFLIAFVNALNLFDGADGLTAGVAAIVAAAYALLPGVSSTSNSGAAAWIIAGAGAAFLCFNFPTRAKIFLGDSGSTVLGFALGFLALDPPESHSQTSSRLLFLLFSAALPVLDLVFGVIRRVRAGRSPLAGDRRHLCDLMLSRGWTTRSLALVCYAATAFLAVIGWLGLQAGRGAFLAISVLVLGALVCGGCWLGELRMSDGEPVKIIQGELQLNRGGRNPV